MARIKNLYLQAYLGAAHGHAGIFYFLLYFFDFFDEVPQFSMAQSGAVDFLRKHFKGEYNFKNLVMKMIHDSIEFYIATNKIEHNNGTEVISLYFINLKLIRKLVEH